MCWFRFWHKLFISLCICSQQFCGLLLSNAGRHHSIDVYRELPYSFNGCYCYLLFFVDLETRLPFKWNSGDIYQWPPMYFNHQCASFRRATQLLRLISWISPIQIMVPLELNFLIWKWIWWLCLFYTIVLRIKWNYTCEEFSTALGK